MHARRPRPLATALAAVLLGLARHAGAESVLRMDHPESFGTIPAATYDSGSLADR